MGELELFENQNLKKVIYKMKFKKKKNFRINGRGNGRKSRGQKVAILRWPCIENSLRTCPRGTLLLGCTDCSVSWLDIIFES